MGTWQRGMIRIARSERITTAVQGRDLLAGLAARFVSGGDLDDAVATALRLRADGVATTVFNLGEYVEDASAVEATVARLERAAPALAAAGLDVHLSIDPTQAGLMTSADLCERNVRRVAVAVAAAAGVPRPGHDALMIDMEDSTTTGPTLAVHDRLRGEGLPVAVTVQAYLHRSAHDLRRLAADGAWVRLVKGALGEPEEVAVTTQPEIDRRFHEGLDVLLSPEARRAGCRPSVATHDLGMVVQAIRLARRHGWAADEFEFEMLYGVRPDAQRELARRGYRVRAYLPFGDDWFPYSIRRVGERPRNLRFAVSAVGRSLVQGRA